MKKTYAVLGALIASMTPLVVFAEEGKKGGLPIMSIISVTALILSLVSLFLAQKGRQK